MDWVYYYRGAKVSSATAMRLVLDEATRNVRRRRSLQYPESWEASPAYWRKQCDRKTVDYRLLTTITIEFSKLWNCRAFK